jgi:hypothetical protein
VAGIDPNRAVKAVRPESAPHGAFHMVVDQLGEGWRRGYGAEVFL